MKGRVIVTIGAFAWATGCAGILGLRDDYFETGEDAGDAADEANARAPDGPRDATIGDTDALPDASTDASTDASADAPIDLDAAPYHVIDDASSWTLASPSASANFFLGAVSDGRYLYAVPGRGGGGSYSGVVFRYDLAASFTAPASWTSFDIAGVTAAAKGFAGAAFDGRYVYFTPDAPAASHGNVARFDTTLPFGDGASWLTYDVYAAGLTAGVGELRGYQGVVYDGARYVYFVPYASDSPPSSIRTAFHGRVLRLDTLAPFDDWASWTVFDLAAQVDVNAAGFTGGVFDGRYLYLVPDANATAARYDTTLAFTSAASWSTFSLTSVHSSTLGFVGGAYDGRFVYFSPFKPPLSSAPGSVAVRFDTTRAFAAAGSWAAIDLVDVLPVKGRGFTTPVFDGRYVYYTPYHDETVLRFDSRGDFLAPDGGAWSSFGLVTALGPNAKNFFGSVWDGHYIYFVPGATPTTFARFDAREAPFTPPAPIQRSSFF
jgi:hypothetical protein